MSFPETVVLTYKEVKAETTLQICPLGTRGILPDGRVYRYAKANADAVIGLGQLVTGQVPEGDFPATSGANLTTYGDTWTTTWSYITVAMSTGTALAKNQYAEGYLVVPAAGSVVRIKSHNAATAASTDAMVVKFEDGDYLPVSITMTDNALVILKNPYDDVEVAAAIGVAGAVALGYSNFQVTAGKYFWLQTWGPVGVESKVAITSGCPISASTETATAVGPVYTTDANTVKTIGIGVGACATSLYAMIMLQLSP